MMCRRPIFFVKIFIVSVAVIVLGFYFFRQSRSFLLGPQISIEYPVDGQTMKKSFISIKGRVLNASIMLVDGQAVAVDVVGNFERKRLLAKGLNIIILSAQDRFGRLAEKKLQLVLK